MKYDPSEPFAPLAEVAQRHPGLVLLVLHGSRARGTAHEHSDWDFGYLGDERLRPGSLWADLAAALCTDRIDLADLARAGGLLRYRVARDGVTLFERREGSFERFCRDAVTFWFDAYPVLRTAYAEILEELGP